MKRDTQSGTLEEYATFVASFSFHRIINHKFLYLQTIKIRILSIFTPNKSTIEHHYWLPSSMH